MLLVCLYPSACAPSVLRCFSRIAESRWPRNLGEHPIAPEDPPLRPPDPPSLLANPQSVCEIPLFHGDQWEMTVPSLLGIDTEDPNYDVNRVDISKLVRRVPKFAHAAAALRMHHSRAGGLPIRRAAALPRRAWTPRTWCRRPSKRCST